MKLDVEISVTAKDLKEGRKTDCRKCPLALAAARAFKKPVVVGGKAVVISGQAHEEVIELSLVVEYKGGFVAYRLPPEAIGAIGYIDDGEADLVMPFKFKVSLS